MIGKALLGLTAAVLLAAGSPEAEQNKKDRANLQGTWKVSGAEQMGEAAPADDIKEMELLFKEDLVQVRDSGKLLQKYKFKLDASKDPRWMDLTYVGGPNNGRTDRAIYKLDGNNLKICIEQFKEDPRPTTFATEKKTGKWLVILERFK